jgi:hypothetical protein
VCYENLEKFCIACPSLINCHTAEHCLTNILNLETKQLEQATENKSSKINRLASPVLLQLAVEICLKVILGRRSVPLLLCSLLTSFETAVVGEYANFSREYWHSALRSPISVSYDVHCHGSHWYLL